VLSPTAEYWPINCCQMTDIKDKGPLSTCKKG